MHIVAELHLIGWVHQNLHLYLLFANGHLDCLPFVATTNNAASLQKHMLSFLLGEFLEVE
jgi:hypothetical protein